MAREYLYPDLAKFAFNIISITGMTAKCERLFSRARHLLTDDRNSMKVDVIEANKCLNAWYKAHLFG